MNKRIAYWVPRIGFATSVGVAIAAVAVAWQMLTDEKTTVLYKVTLFAVNAVAAALSIITATLWHRGFDDHRDFPE